MERFLQQYQPQIKGVLSGPDRMLFRGVLRSVCYVRGLEIFLASIRVLHRDSWPTPRAPLGAILNS